MGLVLYELVVNEPAFINDAAVYEYYQKHDSLVLEVNSILDFGESADRTRLLTALCGMLHRESSERPSASELYDMFSTYLENTPAQHESLRVPRNTDHKFENITTIRTGITKPQLVETAYSDNAEQKGDKGDLDVEVSLPRRVLEPRVHVSNTTERSISNDRHGGIRSMMELCWRKVAQAFAVTGIKGHRYQRSRQKSNRPKTRRN